MNRRTSTTYFGVLSSKGQITIPLAIRERLHLTHKGELVGFEPIDDGVVMRKLIISREEEFTRDEWHKLERLAAQRGRRYANAKEFLKDLGKL